MEYAEQAAAIWLAYLRYRVQWRLEHGPVPAPGGVIPTFDEEVAARTETARTYERLGVSAPETQYFEDLLAVADAALMREYCWTYLRQYNWSEPDALDLPRFKVLQRNKLNGHVVQTSGRIFFEVDAR